MNGGQRGPGFGQVGVQFHRLGELAAGLRHVVLRCEGKAKELVAGRPLRIVLDHALQQLNGFF